MRTILLFLLAWLLLCAQAGAQQLTAAEYFVDTDPGVGNGTAVAINAGDVVTATYNVNGTGIPEGFHTLSTRFMDASGTWGIAVSRLFYVYGSVTGGSDPAPPVTAGEYFIDSDPGTGAATAFSVSQGDQVTAAFSVDGTGLLEGFHTMSVRFKDTEGHWGIAVSRLFYVYGGNGGGVDPASPIAAAEYFFDVDPGVGNGTALPTGVPQDSVSVNTVIDASALPVGTHVLNIRFKDTDGRWGFTQVRPFVVLPAGALQNDECLGATVLPLQPYGTCVETPGTTEDATYSGPYGPATCSGFDELDVWYTVNSGSATQIMVDMTEVSAVDMYAEVLDGCEGGLVACLSTFPNSFSSTPNTTYLLRVFTLTTEGSFGICVSAGPNDCVGVPGGTALPGTACDDGDANTNNDQYQSDCTCKGWDCIGVLGGTTGPGMPCLVSNDPSGAPFYGAYDANCSCIWTDCNNVANGSAYPGGACDDGVATTSGDALDINCNCHGYDCAGVYNGTASLDSCGVCVGGTTGQIACVADCNGDFGGSAYLDNCATCVGGNTGLNPCTMDCHGDYGGTASVDNCGVCSGGNTGVTACVQDCNGEWGGTAYMDNCATCVGGGTGLPPCVQDCNGQWGGTAYVDNCATCVGGTTGLEPCAQDCNGDLGGTAYMDNCGTCVGGNTGQLPCVADCHGDFGGTAAIDLCNVCAGGNTGITPNSSCTDCAGVPNGLSIPDSCGTCLLPSDPAFQTAVRTLSFTGTGNFQSAVLFPQTGEPSGTYTAEVIYTNSANGQLPLGYPRLILDYEGDGIYNGVFDRTVLMSASDANDATTTDGKRYRCTVMGLPTGSQYQTLVQTAEGQCITQIGPFNYPDVLVAPDLEIFANDIRFSTPNPAVNSPLTVYAKVHNRADFAAQGFTVHLVNEFEPSTVYPDITIPWLAAHDTITVSWNITTPNVVAWCPMHVYVDANNVIAETNELNNSAIRPFVNGDFNVPGAIHVYASVDPAVSVIDPNSPYDSVFVSGFAYYSETAVALPDSSVAGATVTIHGHFGETYSAVTNSQGYFRVGVVPMPSPGTYTLNGTVTDYTLTGDFQVSYERVLGCQVGYSVGVSIDQTMQVGDYTINAILVGGTISGNITVTNSTCEDVAVSTRLDASQTGGLPLIGDVMVPPLTAGATFTLPFSGIQFNTPGNYSICGTSDADFILGDLAYHSTWCQGLTVFPTLPDIQPDGQGGIGLNNFLCLVGEPQFRVWNHGAVPSGPFDCTVGVYQDGSFVQNFTHHVADIAPFLWTSFGIPYMPPAVGTYSFVLDCDVPMPNGVVAELDETNNSATYGGSTIACQADLVAAFPCELPVTPVDPTFPGLVTYNAEITNYGNAVAHGPIDVTFEVSTGGTYTTQYAGDLAPLASGTVSVSAPSVAPATAALTLTVDPLNTIPELNEGESATDDLCWEYSLGPDWNCGQSWSWNPSVLGQTSMIQVALHSLHLYTASDVVVRIEVSGPDIAGTALLGDVIMQNAGHDCWPCGVGVALPGSFLFSSEGTYHFTFTVDPDNEYSECNEGNNVLTRDVVITNLPDLRVLSQYINPSELNPDVNEPVTLDVTYENIGYGNLGSTFDLKVMANNDELATVANVPGLVTGGTNTVSIPVPFSSGLVGLHVFRAIIDANNEVAEGDELNNEATRSIVVGAAANLYFVNFTASTSTPNLGQFITFSGIVRNNGDLPISAEVRFYYVNAAYDTIPFNIPMPITVDSSAQVGIGSYWTVTELPRAIIARISNGSILEFNFTDNEARVPMGAITAQLSATPGCPGGPAGTLTANVIGGMPPYQYAWSNGSTGMVLHAEPGNFTVTITDAEGRTTTASGVIPVDTNCGAADCHGDVGGTAYLDNCGTCVGGTTGIYPGTLDTDFGSAAGLNSTVMALALYPSGTAPNVGKVLVGGNFSSFAGTGLGYIARLNNNGQLDTGFAPGTGANSVVETVAMQGDGRAVIGGGFTEYNGTARNRVARLNADGSLDAGFAPGSGANGFVSSVVLQADGRILIAGQFTNYNGTARSRIARLNTDGSLDGSFDPGSGAGAFSVDAIGVRPDGRILIGGSFTTYNGVSRGRVAGLLANGTLDTSFDPGTGANDAVWAVLVQPDGKVVIGGQFTAYNGTPRNRIARINPDGSLDATFAANGGLAGLSGGSVRSLELAADGRILVAGEFDTFDGVARKNLVRLNSDGSLDTSFDPGASANGSILAMTTQPDGKVLLGGAFNSYDGIARSRVARLLGNCMVTVAYDCPYNEANIGDACDDGSTITGNDAYDTNCNCAGQPIDCLGVPGGTATIGSTCDDGSASTGNDVYDANCVCAGQPIDCLGVPGGTATIGTPCDDGNTGTQNDVYDANCTCTGTPVGPCTGNFVVVNITTDASPAQLSWEIRDDANMLVASGAPSVANSLNSETVCLGSAPTSACYTFKLMDSFGDGITGGGWELRTTGGKLLLRDDFAFGSQSPSTTPQWGGYGGGHSFCLPAGPSRIMANECNVFTNGMYDKVYSNKVTGATQYQFEFSDPDAGYVRRIARPHNYVVFYEMVSSPLVPGVVYFTRVRTNEQGPLASAHWGSGCELGLGIAQVVQCTQLIQAPAYGHSCNETRSFIAPYNYLYAKPVTGATTYTFKITGDDGNYNSGIEFVRNTYILALGWGIGEAPALTDQTTYQVQVRVTVNGIEGTYCGNVCNVTIDNNPNLGEQVLTTSGNASLWPNPVRDGQVNLSIGGLFTGSPADDPVATADQRISVDIQDIYGKQVFAQEFSNSGEHFSTILQLPKDIASGVYMVNITVNGVKSVQRLSIIR